MGPSCILCPVSHYKGVLFSFVNNLNIFNSSLEHISPLKVFLHFLSFLLTPFVTKHRPPKTLMQDAGEQFLLFLHFLI